MLKTGIMALTLAAPNWHTLKRTMVRGFPKIEGQAQLNSEDQERLMSKRTVALGAAMALLLVPALPAKADSHWPCPEDVWQIGAGCFELWAECTRFFPSTYVDQKKATEKINEEAVEDAVRSRIRAANLFAPPHVENEYWINKKNVADDEYYLPWRANFSLYVHVVGRAFSVEAQLSKWRVDHFSDEAGKSVAWETETLGYGDETFVLEVVRQAMDKFIENYLRVNDVACRERWRDEAGR